jgi:hypothetical protein
MWDNLAPKLHLKVTPAASRGRSRWNLLSWTLGSSALSPTPELKPVLVPNPAPKKKHSMLPVLVVLFLISYGMMTVLIVEQGRTIESQRALIHSLFSDSTELSHMKGQAQKQRATAQAQAEAKTHSQVQTPSTQDKDKARDQAGADPHIGKIIKPPAPTPPKNGSTLEDVRRIVVSI